MPDGAQSMDRYFQVVDEVIDLLDADEAFTTSRKGTKAASYRKGYAKSLAIDDYTITLNFDLDLWKNPTLCETPYWFAVKDAEWKQTEEIQWMIGGVPEQRRVNHWSVQYLAIDVLQNATLSEVCENIKLQILDVIKNLKEN